MWDIGLRPDADRSTFVTLCVLVGAAGSRAGRRAAPQPARHARRRGGDAVESGHRRPPVGRQRHGPRSRVRVGSRPEPARTGERVRAGCVRAGPRASAERAARALRPVWRGGPGRVAPCWSPKVAVRYPGTTDDGRRCRAAWLCASLTPPSMRQSVSTGSALVFRWAGTLIGSCFPALCRQRLSSSLTL